MHHYTGRDPIAEYWRGEITLRKLRVLVEGLPPTGALGRAITGSPWGTVEYQLAELLDRVGRMEIDFRNANRAEKSPQQEYPDRIPRPGDPSPKQKAKAEAKAQSEAREGYRRLVSRMTPQYADQV
ncbi:hypothetical protein ACGFZA_31700 [Streptomyces sp. NPDC048211]|uniref:hypothetical protein n=1 Tax=Streptomyces sp. NPDC048211 TaxID=3365516 RepID=UPI003714F559